MNLNKIFSGVDQAKKKSMPVRLDGTPPTRFVKDRGGNYTKADVEEARKIVAKRINRIEKGVMSGEYVKGIGRQVLDAAIAQPVAFLSIMDALREGVPSGIKKGFDVVPSPISGLQAYDLEKPAKMLYPVMSPIRNKVPRTTGTGEAANWRAILAVDTGNVGVGVQTGSRAAALSQNTASFSVPYRTIGVENFATFEAQSAAVGFEDILALVVLQALQVLMIREEQILIAGIGNPNEIAGSSFALGTPTGLTLTTQTSGGTLPATTTYYLRVVALSMDGTTRVLPLTNAIPNTVARTNIDGTTSTFNGGFSQASAQGTIATGSGVNSNQITASCTAVPNAYGYLWCMGTTNGSAYTQVAVTNTNSVVITNTGSGNAVLPAAVLTADYSGNSLFFDGIWTQSLNLLSAFVNPSSISVSNPYFTGTTTMINQSSPYFVGMYTSLNGANLTSSGAAGVNEINAWLQTMYDLYKFSPSEMYLHAALLMTLSNLVVANGGAPLIRYVADLGDSGERQGFTANQVIGRYMNPITGDLINILPHPYLVPGKILSYTDKLPYPLNETGNLCAVQARKDYYAEEWPLRTRRYEYGVYSEQMAKCYFPPGFSALDNIGTPTFIPSTVMPLQTGAA